jgi:RND family efflux transporter MFP subunit
MGIAGWLLALFGLGAAPPPPSALPPPPPAYIVRAASVADEKAVFATVQSAFTVPARVRTGGTIVTLRVRQGDYVTRGQLIATVGDPKLALQSSSYAAQIAAAQAQVGQARSDFERAERLIGSGAIARNMFEQSRTAYDVAQSSLKSVQAQSAVVRELASEGAVTAPTSGRVITVPVTAGTVVMPGDTVATVAERDFVLRLQVPERHARQLKAGNQVRLDGIDVGVAGPQFGTLTLVYPQVDNGHVVADAKVAGLGDYFVGQRVRVFVPAGSRSAILVPENLIRTRAGIDYARVWTKAGGALDVPVQRGQAHAVKGRSAQLEILSGLAAGDRLLKP